MLTLLLWNTRHWKRCNTQGFNCIFKLDINLAQFKLDGFCIRCENKPSCYALCFVNEVMRCYNRYSFSISDLFHLINLCLVDTLLTSDVGIHIWAKLKEGRILRYGNNPPRNPQQLWDQVVEIWDDLTQDHNYCLILVDSIPQRCQAVIDTSGMCSTYQVHMLFINFFLL